MQYVTVTVTVSVTVATKDTSYLFLLQQLRWWLMHVHRWWWTHKLLFRLNEHEED